MDYLLIFTYAAIGVISIEIVGLYNIRSRGERLPEILKSPFYWIIQILFALGAGGISILAEFDNPLYALVFGASFPLFVRQMTALNERRVRELEIEKELEEAEVAIEREPERVKPVWEVSRLQLELYISRNQQHVNSIYWITVVVMMVGFGLVGYGVLQAVSGAKIDAAILTTSQGIITEFIGATFLFVYKSTIAQASTYVRTLKRISGVGMSVQIVDSISDDKQEVKNEARAELAKKILDSLGENSSK